MRARLKTLILAAALILTELSGAIAVELKIGVQVPTSGSEASAGADMANAINLAVEEANAKGGILGSKLTTIIGDSACDPQQSVNAASKLVSRGVVGIVGGYCSGATLPTLKIYGDAQLPFVIAAANSTKLIPANPGNAFMINSTSDAQAAKAIEFLRSKGVNKLAIVNEGDAYSQDLANLTREGWTQAGRSVVAFETANKGEQDYSAIVTAIRGGEPEAIFWTAYYAGGGLLIRQLRQAGFQGIIAMSDGSNTPKLFDIAGQAAEGVYCFSNPTPQFVPAAKEFVDAYKRRFKQPPGPYSALAYDSARLLIAAIDRAGSTTGKEIASALAQSADFEGITGSISFTAENTLKRSNFIVLEGKDGKWSRAEM